MMTPEQTILALIRFAVAKRIVSASDFKGSDWQEVYALAKEQGVAGVCFDAIAQLKREGRVERDPILFTEWYGTMQIWEDQYAKHGFEIKNLTRFYRHFGIRMLLLKGYGLSTYWPVPKHRPCGDIDIFLLEEKDLLERLEIVCAQERGDALIAEKLGIKVNTGSSHHSDFLVDGVNVENHKDLLDDESHKANGEIEKAVMSLMLHEEGGTAIVIDGVEINVPSPTFNALYLLRHAGLHFATERLLLRQVLDWGLMVQRTGKAEINWDFVQKHAREQGMERFMDCMIEICVDDLGMDEACFPKFSRQGKLKKRVLADIMAPEFSEENDTTIGLNPHYIIYKVRRFMTNSWKYQLVYPTPMWKIFLNLAYRRIVNSLQKAKVK